jgi:hypothetical protein
MKTEDTIIAANARFPILRVFASWEADAKIERTLEPQESKGRKATKFQADVDEHDFNALDLDHHPLATLHLDNFNTISSRLAKSSYRSDTEQLVLFAKEQHNDGTLV